MKMKVETKNKISETRKKLFKEGKLKVNKGMLGRNHLEESKKNMSLGHKGKHHSPKTEFKKGMIAWNKGKELSYEHKKKLSEKRKKLYNEGMIHPSLGKHHSEETKRKMSNSHIGKLISDENPAKRPEVREKIRKLRMGEKNPAWLGGKSFEPYDKSFNNKFKRAIRKRDNYICMKCGIHQERLKRALDIHHIDYNKLLSIPQNCCSLCNRCNSEVNKNRKQWTKFFQSLLNERYGYEYSEIQEVIIKLNQGGQNV